MLVGYKLKERLARFELNCIRSSTQWARLPILRFCQRRLTADITLLAHRPDTVLGFRIGFRTPYLKLPVEVERSQIGAMRDDGAFDAAAFRFFDWHSWEHIDGQIEWLGERRVSIEGEQRTFVTGFQYRVAALPARVERLGLRLAEGVEGTARVLLGDAIERIRFEPSYWMLEPDETGCRVVAIVKQELMVAVVSLADLGSSNPETCALALERLQEWVGHTFAGSSRERRLVSLLQSVRDWGALGRPQLFAGLKQLIERLGLESQERVFFDFYADHWGVRDNWHGRLVAIRLLEAMATDSARTALSAIHDYVKNREIPAEELALIRAVLHSLEGGSIKASVISGQVHQN